MGGGTCLQDVVHTMQINLIEGKSVSYFTEHADIDSDT